MNYKIIGEPMPVVICELEPNESMITEKGAMNWMSPNMQMQTSGGGVGKMFGRMFSGETMFRNIYTALNGKGTIAFASSFPGTIRAVRITPDKPIVAQKGAFLAAETGVEMSVFFQKRFSAGFFGGEGFIMQKITGNGIVFLEIDGTTVDYDLAAGQSIIVDTGNLAMVDASCTIEVQTVKGAKNIVFGGEGLFNTVVTGPGKVVLQTMPISSVAAAISSVLPSK